jgi:hypothetical protein
MKALKYLNFFCRHNVKIPVISSDFVYLKLSFCWMQAQFVECTHDIGSLSFFIV